MAIKVVPDNKVRLVTPVVTPDIAATPEYFYHGWAGIAPALVHLALWFTENYSIEIRRREK